MSTIVDWWRITNYIKFISLQITNTSCTVLLLTLFSLPFSGFATLLFIMETIKKDYWWLLFSSALLQDLCSFWCEYLCFTYGPSGCVRLVIWFTKGMGLSLQTFWNLIMLWLRPLNAGNWQHLTHDVVYVMYIFYFTIL